MRRPATRAASRPSVSPSAFTTCQRLSISPAFMLYVFIRFIVKQTVLIANLHQAEPTGRGRATGRPRPGLPQRRLELPRGEPPPPHIHQRRGDAAHLAAQEGVRLHVQRQTAAPSAHLSPHHPPAGALPSGERGLRESREVVLTQEGLRRDPHCPYVQRLRNLPDEPPEQRGPLPSVVDGVAIPAAGRPSPGVEVRRDLSRRPPRYPARATLIGSPVKLLRARSSASCIVPVFFWNWEPPKPVPSYSTRRASRRTGAPGTMPDEAGSDAA